MPILHTLILCEYTLYLVNICFFLDSLKLGPIGFSETSAQNCHSVLKERESPLYCDGGLKPRNIFANDFLFYFSGSFNRSIIYSLQTWAIIYNNFLCPGSVQKIRENEAKTCPLVIRETKLETQKFGSEISIYIE